MTTSQIQAFVKFFGEESHADEFVKGNLYMRKLRYFQALEALTADDGRPDPHEGVVSWRQPDRVELKIEIPGRDPIIVGKNDLAGPISISMNFYSDMHLFCMTALSIPDPAHLEGTHEEIQAQLQAAFQVSSRCLEFGPYAVVLGAGKFMPQLRHALKQCEHWYKADLVQYYDEKTFHGDFEVEDVPFRKQSNFAYQKEYRVCLQTNREGDDPFIFDIDDMSAFAIKTRSADINASLKLTLKQRSS
ncbi:MAG: hypothetical protein P4L61_02025 [Candidatus Pacebacteria bacterium]|nr:hypothetical protein [Candidatus Paceibacterota bacterium]